MPFDSTYSTPQAIFTLHNPPLNSTRWQMSYYRISTPLLSVALHCQKAALAAKRSCESQMPGLARLVDWWCCPLDCRVRLQHVHKTTAVAEAVIKSLEHFLSDSGLVLLQESYHHQLSVICCCAFKLQASICCCACTILESVRACTSLSA